MTTILLAALLLAQDAAQPADARERADGARRKCAAVIAGTDGLSTIGMAGSGTDYKILLVVRDPAVKKSIQDRLGGDAVDGIPVLWSVRNSAATVVAPPPPAPAVDSEPETETSDPSTLDYRRRRYAQPEWWGKPRIVWEYRNGWNGHKIPKWYWVTYRYWWGYR